jgi:hypothetical protein
MGATRAAVIKAADIPVDERVTLKYLAAWSFA